MSFNNVSSVLPAPSSWSRFPAAGPGGGSLSTGAGALLSDLIFHFEMEFMMIFITPSGKFNSFKSFSSTSERAFCNKFFFP